MAPRGLLARAAKRLQKSAQYPAWPESQTYSRACPNCLGQIRLKDIDRDAGTAICTACGQRSDLDDVTASDRFEHPEILEDLPECVAKGTVDDAQLYVSARRIPIALALLGGVLLFAGTAVYFGPSVLAGAWFNLYGHVPPWLGKPLVVAPGPHPAGWFPVVGMGVVSAAHAAAALMCLSTAVMHLLGSYRLQVGSDRCIVSLGIGPIRLRWRFDPRAVRRMGVVAVSDVDTDYATLCIVADRTLTFGSILPDRRQDWLCVALSRLLRQPGAGDPAALFKSQTTD